MGWWWGDSCRWLRCRVRCVSLAGVLAHLVSAGVSGRASTCTPSLRGDSVIPTQRSPWMHPCPGEQIKFSEHPNFPKGWHLIPAASGKSASQLIFCNNKHNKKSIVMIVNMSKGKDVVKCVCNISIAFNLKKKNQIRALNSTFDRPRCLLAEFWDLFVLENSFKISLEIHIFLD